MEWSREEWAEGRGEQGRGGGLAEEFHQQPLPYSGGGETIEVILDAAAPASAPDASPLPFASRELRRRGLVDDQRTRNTEVGRRTHFLPAAYDRSRGTDKRVS